VLLLLGLATRLAAAAASQATDLCAASADPCVVTADVTVAPNTTLDFGGRALDLRPGASLAFTSGTLEIRAGSLRVEAGASILGSAPSGSFPTLSVVTAGDIRVEASSTTKGKIDLSGGPQGGLIELATLGAMQVDGLLLARATQAAGFGGAIDLLGVCVGGPSDGSTCAEDIPDCGNVAAHGTCSGGDRVIQGSLNASAPDEGGDVAVIAPQGSITIAGSGINASGGEDGGGTIDLEAGGNVTTGAPLNVNGGGLSGDAGSVTVFANGSVSIGGAITGNAGGSVTEGGGAGADVEITAVAGTLTVTAGISADSGVPDGDGGEVDLTAGMDIVQTGSISAAGRGVDAAGGDVAPSAGRSLTLGAIDVSGGNGGGGSIFADAGGSARLQGQLDGDGGATFQVVAATIAVTSRVHADAYDGFLGGAVILRACDVAVNAGAVLSSLGPTGENLLQASGQMTIGGTLTSTANRLEYLDPAKLPQVATGAVVAPPPAIAQNSLLPPCGTPPARCGNGVVEDGEECDDGNTAPCDGCSASCTTEGCGNGVTECDEQCDDGARNGTAGDGCDASCRLLGTIRYLPAAHVDSSNCFLEWAIENPNSPVVNGFPSANQTCIDGDPACDADGASDGTCTFRLGACIDVDDPRLPTCHPPAIKLLELLHPPPLNPADATDVVNLAQLVPALEALGPTFKAGSTVLSSGTPVTERNVCTPLLPFVVPHLPGLIASRVVDARATDTAGHRMGGNRMTLTCEPNPAVCGNGIKELGEECDDGNATPCDGCSAACRLECGNGVVECGEQCDDGVANGTPGDRCAADCQMPPPPLRIPGGGAAASDCGLEWSLEMGPPTLARNGVPAAKQVCVDGDPACDFDPTPGTCRFHLWACLGGEDARLGCAAGAVSAVDLLRPTAFERAQNVAARNTFLAAVGRLPSPAGPGERCTGRMDADVPSGRTKLVIRTLAHGPGPATDRDVLQLACVPPPGP